MKRLLITGARAPVALELARLFRQQNWEIYIADTMKAPLTRGSNSITRYFQLPPPKQNVAAFIQQLIDIVTVYQIDYLIPTCEEIFFISKYKALISQHCIVFCDEFSKISQFHHKYQFIQLAQTCDIFIPQTTLLEKTADWLPFLTQTEQFVFKPVFSRFAAETHICPTPQKLTQLIENTNKTWVAQQFIAGKEFCSYSVAIEGKLTAHSCYHPLYRVGLGSGMYFQPVQQIACQTFVSQFVKKYHFTGQIGFDFIANQQGQLFVLECNPRATSGIHLFNTTPQFISAFFDDSKVIEPADLQAKMAAAAMLIFGFPYGIFEGNGQQFFHHYAMATDIIHQKSDKKPTFYQFISLLEIIYQSVKQRTSLWKAATTDTEWNGESL